MKIRNQTNNRQYVPTLEKKRTTNRHRMQPPQATNTYKWFNAEEAKEEQEIKTSAIARALIEWRDMPQEQRNRIRLSDFAERQEVDPWELSFRADQDGLTQFGEAFLTKTMNIVNNTTDNIQMPIQEEKNDEQNIGNNHYPWFNDVNDNEKLDESTTPYTLFNHEEKNDEPNVGNNPYSGFNHVNENKEQEIKNLSCLRQNQQRLINALVEWRKMSQEQRTEISIPQFAKKNEISLGYFKHYASPNGLKKIGQERLSRTEAQYTFIKETTEHLKKLHEIHQEKPYNLDLSNFAKKINLPTESFQKLFNEGTGITLRGKQLMQKYEGHKFNGVTDEILNAWSQLPQNKRNKKTLEEFTILYNVKIHSLRECVLFNKENALNVLGRQLIQKSKSHKFDTINEELVEKWCNMSQEQRNKMGVPQFAETHNLSYHSAKHYLSRTGRRQSHKPPKPRKLSNL